MVWTEELVWTEALAGQTGGVLRQDSSGEPDFGPWRPVDEGELAGLLGGRLPVDGPALVLVDGRSGAGKSTLAARIVEALAAADVGMDGRGGGGSAAVVHTDDVAWCYSPMNWADALVSGILEPWSAGWSAGGPVTFRPPGWEAKGRPGAIEIPAGTRILVVEGVGAGRAELAARADLVVWVQSDALEARRRGVARDVDLGRTLAQAEDFWDEWGSFEDPFLAADRPWERADFVVLGTPAESTSTMTWLSQR